MTREYQKLFVQIMTPLFQAQQSVVDLFFKNRLNENIERTIDRHIQYWAHPSQESQREYIRVLKDLDGILQEITYLEKGDAIQLAISQEQVLRYFHNFLQGTRTEKQIPVETEVVRPVEPTPRPVVSNVVSVIQKSGRGKGKLSETQQNILEFVRQEPDCRTKDVINQFSALSQRTIKRNLRELNKEGRIVKRSDGAAVYYSAV